MKLAEEQQQQGGQHSLDGQRGGRGLEARADAGELAKEEPVAGGGKGNASAAHDRSVERDEDGEGHGGGHKARSGMAGDDGERSHGRPLAGGDLRGGQNVLDGGVGGHEEHADDEQAADQRDGQAALRPLHFAGHHGQVVPAVVGPESGDERRMKPPKPPTAWGSVVEKLAHEPEAEAKQKPRDDEDENYL